MRTKLLFLLAGFVFLQHNLLQAQPMLFAHDYASANDLSNIAEHCNTSDGGAILISHTVGTGFIHYNVVAKTAANGTWQWTRRFVVPNCNLSNIIQLSDGNYCFSYIEGGSSNTYKVIKLDTNGNTLYNNTYVLPGNYQCADSPSILAKANGGFYLASHLRWVSVTYAWTLMEIDLNGNLLWANYYNDAVEVNIAMSLCANGDIVVCGARGLLLSTTNNPFITRVSSSGQLLWSKYYAFSGTNVDAYAIQELGNGNIAVVGRISGSMTVPNDAFYLQTDAGGTLIRTKRYSNPQSLLQANAAVAVENNYLIISGNAGINGSGTFFAKLDMQCNVLHCSFYNDVYGFSLGKTTVPGYSISGNNGSSQHMILLTTDTATNSCMDVPFLLDTSQFLLTESALTGTSSISLTQGTFSPSDTIMPFSSNDLCSKTDIASAETAERLLIYPNPAAGIINVNSTELICLIDVVDVNGKSVKQEAVLSTFHRLDVSGLTPGLYVLFAEFENHIESRRLIVE